MTQDLAQLLKQLAAPLPPSAISWRQDGRPGARQGKWFARFVAYTDAQVVQERLDSVFPGQWSLVHDQLPERGDDDGVPEVSMKCRITIRVVAGDALDTFSITREGIGSGKNYKEASTDSFKRAAVRFGIGAELYDYGPNWVQVDSDGKFAKPIEDPAAAYARKMTKGSDAPSPAPRPAPTVRQQVDAAFPDTRPYDPYEPPNAPPRPQAAPAAPAPAVALAPMAPVCPICGSSDMWDKRLTKTGKQPDFKCKTKGCDGAIWVPSAAKAQRARAAVPSSAPYEENPHEFPAALRDEQDDLPF